MKTTYKFQDSVAVDPNDPIPCSFQKRGPGNELIFPDPGEMPENDPKQPTFWRRQFAIESTRKQANFDWWFGVILPLLCVLADPIVFKGGLDRGPLLGTARPFAYLLGFSSIIAMAGWLLLDRKLRIFAAPLSGLFLAGAGVSFLVGFVLLPFSLVGTFVAGIGLLGFTPLFSSFVFLRNGIRSFRTFWPTPERNFALATSCLAGMLSLVLPFVINVKITEYVNEMAKGDAATIRSHAAVARYFAPLVNANILAGQECGTPDSERHRALADAYYGIVGESIERTDFRICNDF